MNFDTRIPGQARSELSALLDAAVDAVVIIDHRGTMQTFNRSAERLFGYRPADAIGSNVSMLMPEPDRSAHDSYMARYLATGEARIIGKGREVRAQRKDGSEFPVMLSVGRIEGTDPPRFVGFLHDLTAFREMEAQAQAAQEGLTRVDRLSLMGEMASGLAHEVNQPLSAISTYAQAARRLLQRGSAEELPEILEALDEISAQALRAGDIIRWLRSFSKGHQGGHESIDPARLIAQVLPLASMRARRHGIRIETELAPGLPQVPGNPFELQQVLLNLVNNSIDALIPMTSGERIVMITAHRQRDGQHDELEVAVEDSGPGVTGKARDRLFSPFFTTKEQGTGLGLAISTTIVRAHGGKLRFRDRSNGGACFYFSLPTQSTTGPG